MKHFVYKYFGIISVCLFSAVIVITVCFMDTWEKGIPLMVAVISSVFLVQKHKLEELRLFTDLFKDFNERYNELNEDLNDIIKPNNKVLSDDEIDTLFDYFNLCGEEYLYYKEGYILPCVWKAWKNGMKVYFENDRVKKLWDEECKTESYYGFKP